MRVGAFVAGYTPESGGGHTFETDILEGLLASTRETSHRFCLLTASAAVKPLRRRLAGSGMEVFPVSSGVLDNWLTPLLRDSSFLRAHWRRPSPLDRAAIAAGVDLIWFLGAGAHLTDLPFVTVVWDLQHRATPWFPEMSAAGLWDGRELTNGWFLRRATAVITGTETGRDELERFYQLPPERVRILPHPTPRFALEAKEQTVDYGAPRRLGIEREYLLYPAQFWPHKNHSNLLLALARLRDQYNLELDLALVGSDKGNRIHVESLASELGLARAVHFLGFVSRDELVALYQNAVALTYVSWCGPENLPPLEAFALGCPVVATRIPGAEEQLGNAAVLCAPGDPDEIARAVKAVNDDGGLRERLVTTGRNRARNWTAREYVHGVFSFLDEFEPIVRCWRPTLIALEGRT